MRRFKLKSRLTILIAMVLTMVCASHFLWAWADAETSSQGSRSRFRTLALNHRMAALDVRYGNPLSSESVVSKYHRAMEVFYEKLADLANESDEVWTCYLPLPPEISASEVKAADDLPGFELNKDDEPVKATEPPETSNELK